MTLQRRVSISIPFCRYLVYDSCSVVSYPKRKEARARLTLSGRASFRGTDQPARGGSEQLRFIYQGPHAYARRARFFFFYKERL